MTPSSLMTSDGTAGSSNVGQGATGHTMGAQVYLAMRAAAATGAPGDLPLRAGLSAEVTVQVGHK